MKKIILLLLFISYTFILSAQNERIEMEIDANKKMTIKVDSVIIHGIIPDSPILLAELDSSIVKVNQRLSISNNQLNGIGLLSNYSGNHSIGILSNYIHDDTSSVGTIIGIKSEITNLSSSSIGNHVGGYFDVSGSQATGIFVKANSITTQTGESWAGIFESDRQTGGLGGGIKVKVMSNDIGSFTRTGGLFEVPGRFDVAVHGKATGTGLGTSFPYYGVGGQFESDGFEGKGLIALASSSLTTSFNIAGEFITEGGQGIGIVVNANNNDANSNTIGGEFFSAGEDSKAIYAVSTNSTSDNLTIGGEFVSMGNQGIGLRGITDNSSSQILSYGGYFESKGQNAEGVYGVASNSTATYQTIGVRGEAFGMSSIGVRGSADNPDISATNYGGVFISQGGQGVGIQASAKNSATNSNNIGGLFGADGEQARAVRGVATNSNSDNLTIGGEFISLGKQGIGVRGSVDNASSQVLSYGGYFESNGENAEGVYGFASNATTSYQTVGVRGEAVGAFSIGVRGEAVNSNGTGVRYGGFFKATSVNGIGVKGEGPLYGVYSEGPMKIEGTVNDAILLMQSTTGLENRVIVLQDNDEDIFFGDIDGRNRDVLIRSNGLNRINVKNSGRIGISENSPTDLFHIDNPSTVGSMRIQNAGATKLRLYNNGSISIGHNAGSAGVSRGIQLANSTTVIEGNGRAFAWETYSDERIKSNIAPIHHGLSQIMQLKPMQYHHHSSKYDEERGMIQLQSEEYKPTIGFLAQEVHKIIPEAVTPPQDESKDLWGMDYDKLIPVLVKGMQEQQEIIESLLKQNKELMKRVESLESNSETSNTNFPK